MPLDSATLRWLAAARQVFEHCSRLWDKPDV